MHLLSLSPKVARPILAASIYHAMPLFASFDRFAQALSAKSWPWEFPILHPTSQSSVQANRCRPTAKRGHHSSFGCQRAHRSHCAPHSAAPRWPVRPQASEVHVRSDFGPSASPLRSLSLAQSALSVAVPLGALVPVWPSLVALRLPVPVEPWLLASLGVVCQAIALAPSSSPEASSVAQGRLLLVHHWQLQRLSAAGAPVELVAAVPSPEQNHSDVCLQHSPGMDVHRVQVRHCLLGKPWPSTLAGLLGCWLRPSRVALDWLEVFCLETAALRLVAPQQGAWQANLPTSGLGLDQLLVSEVVKLLQLYLAWWIAPQP
mmetsp:Transcript_10205/g.23123  ORF Transcript_10205/g.23123 Transcript_10205/m.23123 type:complete len:318 (-) Transcript_10205:1005-1958(-)